MSLLLLHLEFSEHASHVTMSVVKLLRYDEINSLGLTKSLRWNSAEELIESCFFLCLCLGCISSRIVAPDDVLMTEVDKNKENDEIVGLLATFFITIYLATL